MNWLLSRRRGRSWGAGLLLVAVLAILVTLSSRTRSGRVRNLQTAIRFFVAALAAIVCFVGLDAPVASAHRAPGTEDRTAALYPDPVPARGADLTTCSGGVTAGHKDLWSRLLATGSAVVYRYDAPSPERVDTHAAMLARRR